MKKTICKALNILPALCMILCLAACGAQNAAGGLGTLDMGDGKNSPGGIGTLGDPSQPTESSGPIGTNEPTAPAPTSPAPTAPTPEPKPAALSTEPYECKYFTVTKPVGWEVYHEVFDAGGGAKRIYAFVYDPANPNNMFFFAQVLEPFYVSESAKKAWLSYMPAYYSKSPVISGDPSAEATLRVWGDAFSLMSAEGSEPSTYFRNYQLSEVIESKQISSSATSGTTSYVLGKVSIPGAKEQSLMLFQNTLVLMSAPTGLPSSAKYYASHGNNGVVLSLSTADSQFKTVLACLQSFNFQAFADSNSAQGDVKGSRVAVPETDVSSLY